MAGAKKKLDVILCYDETKKHSLRVGWRNIFLVVRDRRKRTPARETAFRFQGRLHHDLHEVIAGTVV